MADTRRIARMHANACRAFELQPVRSRVWRIGAAMIWMALAAALGAGVMAMLLQPKAEARCSVIAPGTPGRELSDTQFQLARERAARATFQASADSAQATIKQLQDELLFLRTHSR
jgi:hypothetical protein